MDENVDQIITQLLRIEDECDAVTKRAIADKASLETRLAAKKAEIDARTDERLAQELAIIRGAAVEEARSKQTDVSVRSQSRFAEMEASFDDNREQWAEDVFNRVISL